MFRSHYAFQNCVRGVIFLLLTIISLLITPNHVTAGNQFNFDPIPQLPKLPPTYPTTPPNQIPFSRL
ncbi:hypothetical protein [Neisseria sicca]|uniref:hypothetical protein n=1 Tax=Neisseria sicca TaxID=490 RepID=UPI003F6899CB